jgi:acetate kinase
VTLLKGEVSSPVLVLNSGSSSLKYQLLVPATGEVLAVGSVEKIGEATGLTTHRTGEERFESDRPVPDHAAALAALEDQFAAHGPSLDDAGIVAVGHRVVHGGARFSDPTVIDDAVLAEIRALSSLAPLHNPGAAAGIEAARQRFASVPHVAVFDTAFFTTLSPAAYTYAIPVELAEQHQIRRYGMHGTSHQYVSGVAASTLGRDPAGLNQIVLHLGNGCSASAIRGGVAIDTSMGLTPLQGLVMGTRSGDVDPSLHSFLNRELGLTIQEIDTLLNKSSGLKGLSGVNDFRELESLRARGDAAAQLAFDVYIHRLKHYVGAYLAQLGRLDALTFTAGVGENTPAVRAATVAGLEGLGITVDPELNEAPSREARVISPEGAPTAVLVVPTNEELAIGRQALAVIGTLSGPNAP